MKSRVLSLLILLILPIPCLHAEWAWIEGEQAASTNIRPHPWYAGQVRKDLLSGGDFLAHFDAGKKGEATYRFRVEQGGRFHFWVRANPVQSSLKYSLNGAPPVAIATGNAVGGAVNLASDGKPDLRFIGWLDAGSVELKAGENVLAFTLDSPNSNHGAIDCFVLSNEPFAPSGILKPDQLAQADRQLAEANKGCVAWNPPADDFHDSPIDLRRLNEKFAGEKGRIVARGDGFVHESDGQPVRFWAVNGTGASDPAGLARSARMLAKYGVNLVRQHGTVFDEKTGEWNPAIAQKRGEAVDALKKEGIYSLLSIYFPLWMKPEPGPGWREGYDGRKHPIRNWSKNRGLCILPPIRNGLFLRHDPFGYPTPIRKCPKKRSKSASTYQELIHNSDPTYQELAHNNTPTYQELVNLDIAPIRKWSKNHTPPIRKWHTISTLPIKKCPFLGHDPKITYQELAHAFFTYQNVVKKMTLIPRHLSNMWLFAALIGQEPIRYKGCKIASPKARHTCPWSPVITPPDRPDSLSPALLRNGRYAPAGMGWMSATAGLAEANLWRRAEGTSPNRTEVLLGKGEGAAGGRPETRPAHREAADLPAAGAGWEEPNAADWSQEATVGGVSGLARVLRLRVLARPGGVGLRGRRLAVESRENLAAGRPEGSPGREGRSRLDGEKRPLQRRLPLSGFLSAPAPECQPTAG